MHVYPRFNHSLESLRGVTESARAPVPGFAPPKHLLVIGDSISKSVKDSLKDDNPPWVIQFRETNSIFKHVGLLIDNARNIIKDPIFKEHQMKPFNTIVLMTHGNHLYTSNSLGMEA